MLIVLLFPKLLMPSHFNAFLAKIVLPVLFHFFFFLNHVHGMQKFLGQGLNLLTSSDPSHSSKDAISLIAELPGNSSILFHFLFSFYNCTCAIWKFPGYGLNQSYSWGLYHSHDNTRSELNLWPTLQLAAMLDEWGQGSNLHPHRDYVGFLIHWATTGTPYSTFKSHTVPHRFMKLFLESHFFSKLPIACVVVFEQGYICSLLYAALVFL